jgi:hypothetical protein
MDNDQSKYHDKSIVEKLVTLHRTKYYFSCILLSILISSSCLMQRIHFLYLLRDGSCLVRPSIFISPVSDIFTFVLPLMWARDNSVKWLAMNWTVRVQFPAGARPFLFATAVPRWLWGPPCPVPCLTCTVDIFSRGKIGRCVELTTHLHLVPISIMHGSLPPQFLNFYVIVF